METLDKKCERLAEELSLEDINNKKRIWAIVQDANTMFPFVEGNSPEIMHKNNINNFKRTLILYGNLCAMLNEDLPIIITDHSKNIKIGTMIYIEIKEQAYAVFDVIKGVKNEPLSMNEVHAIPIDFNTYRKSRLIMNKEDITNN